MIELKLNVSDVDYEALIQALAGSLAGPALMAARMMPDNAREELVVKFLNTNAATIQSKMEQALQTKGIRARITGAQATKLP